MSRFVRVLIALTILLSGLALSPFVATSFSKFEWQKYQTVYLPMADISIILAGGPAPVLVFDDLTYSIIVTNNGPENASNVTLMDSLPADVSFVSATPSQGSCSGTTLISCALGNLTHGAYAVIALTIIPEKVGTLSNTATTSASVNDPDPANNSAWVNISVVCWPPSTPSISVPEGLSCGSVSGDVLLLPPWTDEASNHIDLYCRDKAPNADEFSFEYFPVGDASIQVGRCPWVEGMNEGNILYAGDTNGNGSYNCFLETFWRSVEPDFVASNCAPGCTGFGCQGTICNSIDWYEYEFFQQTGTLFFWHFASLDGPGGSVPDILISQNNSANFNGFVQGWSSDMGPRATDAGEMTTVEYDSCDNDRDGDCDSDDLNLIRDAIGQCIDGGNYNRLADVDRNDCVTSEDLELLFPGIIYLPTVVK